MKVKKVNSNREVNIEVRKYLIKWGGPCRSKFQFEVKQWFKKYWLAHICLEEFRLPGSLLRCDLVNLTKRLIVEVNGIQHGEFNKHFHRDNRTNFLDQMTRDQIKRNWAEVNNFKIIEIEPEDLPLSVDFFKEKYGVNIL